MATGECSHSVLDTGDLDRRLFAPFLLDTTRIPSTSELARLKFDGRVGRAYWCDAVFGDGLGRFRS